MSREVDSVSTSSPPSLPPEYVDPEVVTYAHRKAARKPKTKYISKSKKKKRGAFRALGKVALWMFGMLIALPVILYLLGDEPESTHSTLKDIAFHPETVLGSGTTAFEIEPITGVILKAKHGAIDKNREFQAEKLTDHQVKEIAEQLTGTTAVPLKGIHIDSGMKDSEIFPGTLDVELSLSEFDIPSSMINSLCILRTEANGTSTIIPSKVINGFIQFSTERNSFFSLAITPHFFVALGIGLTTVLPGIAVTCDSMKKEGYLRDDLTLDTDLLKTGFLEINDLDGYRLFYPSRMAPGNPAEVKRIADIIANVFARYNIEVSATHFDRLSKSPDLMIEFWDILHKDQDYVDVQKLLNNPQWRQENLWPKEIVELYKRLLLADTYLFGNNRSKGRGFKKYDTLDIIAFDKWPSSTLAPAICINPLSKQPYVHVNMQNSPMPGSPAMKRWWDAMLPTLVHEIFHSCQVRYLGTFSIDREKDTWFWEATAITIEKQAREYFEKQQMISRDEMIISQENSNYRQKSLAFVEGYEDPIDLQNQGYAYAPLIEYISDQYSANTGKPKEDYINYALEKYAETRDPRATLVKTTTNSKHGFEELYKKYCHESLPRFITGYALSRTAKYPFPAARNLTRADPVYPVGLNVDRESLSVIMRKFIVREADTTKEKSVKLVLRGTVDEVMSYSDNFSIATVSMASNEAYRELQQPGNMSTDEFDVDLGFGTVANKNSFFLQDVNYGMDNNVDRIYQVFAMYRPVTPMLTFNKVTEERWYLNIQYDRSNLKDMDYVDDYKITLRCPNGDVFSFITEENELDLPTSYDRQTLSDSIHHMDTIHAVELIKADRNSTITGDFALLYRELTSSDAKVMGPQSMAAKLEVDGIVDLTADADELSIDERITYEVTVTPDKGHYTYHWFMDGFVDQEGGSTLQLTFEEAGSYTSTVTVSDEKGKNIGSDSWTCTVGAVDAADGINLVAYWVYHDFEKDVQYNVEAHEVYPGLDVNFIVNEGETWANEEYTYTWIVNGVKDDSAGKGSKWGNHFRLNVEHEARDWSTEIKGGVIGIGETTVWVEVYDKKDRFIGKDRWIVHVKEPAGDYLQSPIFPDGDEE